MIAPISRIILRYGAGYLVLHGLLSAGDGKGLVGDADALALTEMVLGAGLAAMTEAWYYLAKRLGWKV